MEIGVPWWVLFMVEEVIFSFSFFFFSASDSMKDCPNSMRYLGIFFLGIKALPFHSWKAVSKSKQNKRIKDLSEYCLRWFSQVNGIYFTETFWANKIFHWFYLSEMHPAELPSSHRFRIVEQFVRFDVDLWFEGQTSKRFCRKSRAD